jgi:hypothetical protein
MGHATETAEVEEDGDEREKGDKMIRGGREAGWNCRLCRRVLTTSRGHVRMAPTVPLILLVHFHPVDAQLTKECQYPPAVKLTTNGTLAVFFCSAFICFWYCRRLADFRGLNVRKG